MKASAHRTPAMGIVTVVVAIVSLVLIPHAAYAAAYTPPASNRVDLDLGSVWKFRKGDVSGAQHISFDDSNWLALDLPHTWNNLDGQDGGNNYYRGIGWYRKQYTVPSTYDGRKMFLQFDGANTVTDVWVNGTHLGQHKGGYAGFRFDATAAIKIGTENLIAVKVDNAYNADIPPLTADFTFFGGLYRGVRLLMADKLQIQPLDFGASGVYLKQTNVSAASADLQITTKVSNGYSTSRNVTITSVVVDAGNTIVKTLTSSQTIAAGANANVLQKTTIASPHLWNGRKDPYLYRVYVEIRDAGVVIDLVSQPLGFRFFNVDANRGFFLNGQYLDLHGVNRHQDRLDKGWAISDAEHDQDFAMIEEIGATAIRLAHYQHAQRFYDLSDRNGMVVWAEIPLVDALTNSTASFDNAKQQLTELIRQNYNHPSIAFWSIGNELRNDDSPTNSLLTQLNDLVHSEDPTRLSAYAHCCSSNTNALTSHTDVIGYNEYFGWYGGTYHDFAGWADNLHASSPSRKIAVSEYGAGASIFQHADNPPKPDQAGPFHPEEYQSLLHEAYWNVMKTRPFLWGKLVWNMFDFASDKRTDGDGPGRNDKGLVTYDRKTRKDAFFWYKANWRDWSQPDGRVVYITSRRYTNRTSPITSIKVYSNADSVELKLNGVSLGRSNRQRSNVSMAGRCFDERQQYRRGHRHEERHRCQRFHHLDVEQWITRWRRRARHPVYFINRGSHRTRSGT
jgi:beta-galactosidase